MSAPSDEPRRIYVSHGPHDDPSVLSGVREALEQVGYVPLGAWSVPNIGDPQTFPRSLIGTADGAVVLVGPAALDSRTVASESVELLARHTREPFPVVALLADPVSPAEVRTSGLAELGTLAMPEATSFSDRLAETIRFLDEAFAGSRAAGLVELSTISVIDARSPLRSVALGEVAGRPVVVAGGVDGTVRVWDLARPGAATVLRGHEAQVSSVAVGTLGGAAAIISGSEDKTVRAWDAVTGKPQWTVSVGSQVVSAVVARLGEDRLIFASCGEGVVEISETGELRKDRFLPDRAFNGLAIDGRGAVYAAGGDGVVRAWSDDDVPVVLGETGAATRAVAIRGDAAFTGGSGGVVRRWDIPSRQETHRVDTGADVYELAAGVVNGVSVVVIGGNSNLVRLWDPHENVQTELVGHTGSVTGVAIGALGDRSIVVSGSLDGTVRVWGGQVADQVDWLSDAPSRRDLLHRRPLARAVGTRLRKMNAEEPATSFLVHVDGPWGAGKSTLMTFLETELQDDFVTVQFNAWREAGIGPAWWALLTALRESVRRQRRPWARFWLLLTESAARLKRVGAPFLLALILLLLLATGIFWLTPVTLTGLRDTASTISGGVAAIGVLWAGTLVASRFLLWDSARGARLFEQSNTNPMLEVTRHFGWLLRKSTRPVVFLIDDLDRCPDTYVVELLDSVQTLVRDSGPPSAHFVVAADGAWIRTSYELHYATFAGVIAEPGRPLGYLFLDKFFQLRIPVPAIDATRQRQYLRELLRGPAAPPPAAVTQEESRVRQQLDRSTTEAQVVETLRNASDEVRDRVAGAALDRLTTPEAVAATEHSLQRFARLLPPNPRTMKRFVNTYSAMRAVRTLEGNPVRVESLALWTIIEIRWPGLADHLRARPESIGLVGQQELDEVPESLRPLFGDPALRLLTGFDQTAPFDADLIRTCCGTVTFEEQP